MHPVLIKIRDAVQRTAYDGDLFLVGGAVRDELLGLPESNDFDLVTRQSAPRLATLLFEQGLSSFAPVIFERFGTAMIEIDGIKIELITARKESYEKKSRKPKVEAGNYLDDSHRRDFTINTLMRSLATGELVDPLGTGIQDLEERILRTPLDPVKTFDDDPLRMLRAVRFRWRFGLTPVKGLYDAIYMRRGRLKIISFERIRDELSKMLVHPTAPEALDDLMKLRIFEIVAPEFNAMVGCEQGDYHHLDVWDHTRKVVGNVVEHSDDLLLNLGALLHDVGKPSTKTLDDQGKIRFFGHESAGEGLARTILARWKFSGDEIDHVAKLVRNHMRLGSAPVFTETAARRLIKDLGEDLERLLDLVEADANALKAGVRVFDLTDIRATISKVESETPPDKLTSPLSGTEIMELTGLQPGQEVGKIKRALDEQVLEGTLQPDDKETAQKFVLANLSTFES